MVSNVKVSLCNMESKLNGIEDKQSSLMLLHNTRSRNRRFKSDKIMSTTTASKTTINQSNNDEKLVCMSSQCLLNNTHPIIQQSKSTTSGKRIWNVGDRIHVKLLQSKTWHLSKIIAINRNERKLKIHYYNLNSKYDEWLPLRSTRIKRIECINSTNNNNNIGIVDKIKNVDVNQYSNHNNTLMDDKQPRNQRNNKLLSTKKINRMKQSNRASFVETITESETSATKCVMSNDISLDSMKLLNGTTSTISVGNINEKTGVSTIKHSRRTTNSNRNKMRCNNNSSKIINECTISKSNKNDNIENDVLIKSEDTNIHPTKTYHTRRINKRYSLDTIVVDESFNKSGILSNQGNYIRTGSKPKRTTKRLSISAHTTPRLHSNRKHNTIGSNSSSSSNSKKSITLKSRSKPKNVASKSIKSSYNSMNDATNDNSNTIGAVDCHKDTNKSLANNIDTTTNVIISRDILTTSDDKHNNVDTQNNSDNIVNQKEIQSITNESTSPSYFNDGVVRCLCKSREDDGIMLQCEHCLTWQHGHCLGYISYIQIPANYICLLCCNPYFQKSSIPISYITLLSNGYLSNNILNQKCNLTPEMSRTIANTFKLRDYVVNLKSQLGNTNLDIDMTEHVNELFDIFNKLESKSNQLFELNPSLLEQCLPNDDT